MGPGDLYLVNLNILKHVNDKTRENSHNVLNSRKSFHCQLLNVLRGVNLVKNEIHRTGPPAPHCNFVATEAMCTDKSTFLKADSSSASHEIPSFSGTHSFITVVTNPTSGAVLSHMQQTTFSYPAFRQVRKTIEKSEY
jgi:hypothetical protein